MKTLLMTLSAMAVCVCLAGCGGGGSSGDGELNTPPPEGEKISPPGPTDAGEQAGGNRGG